jgi:putative ABC transport system permease protein
VEAFLQDLRYAARALGRNPGFAAVAVLTLALGIGATTAIFSTVDHVVLRPLAYTDADRVVTLWETDRALGETHNEVSAGNFIEWEQRIGSFESMGLAEPSGIDLAVAGSSPESFPSWAVTDGFFDALGVRPILGPGFAPEHFVSGGPAAVMISHALWQRRFGEDPRLVGQIIDVNGTPTVVAGVLPPWLEYPAPKDFWTPKPYRDDEAADRVGGYMHAVGRLSPHTTFAEAQAEADAAATSMARDFPRTNADAAVRLVPLKEEIVGDARPPMLALLGAAGLLLLIACANVAHLVLARAANRGHELAVRATLGAGRIRLARQLLAECLLLAVLGGAAGIGFAAAGVEAIVALSPPELPRIAAASLDGRALAFAAAVTLATLTLFGLAPVLRMSRSGAGTAPSGSRTQSAGRPVSRFRGGLVVAETAFAAILLIGAGLLARSFDALVSQDLGFAVEGRATLQAFIWDRNPTAEQRLQRVAAFDAAFESLPDVESAAVVSALPFHPTTIEQWMQLEIPGLPPADGAATEISVLTASHDYFATMGIPLLRGQLYAAQQRTDGRAEVVINATLARRFFQGEDPLGREVSVAVRGEDPMALQVIGVVGDVRPATFASEARPELYLPYSRSGTGSVTFVVRTSRDASAMMPLLRRQFWHVDPHQAIYHEATLEQLVSDTLLARRFQLLLNGAFAAMALALVAVGVFGVISFASSQRVNEIGIRMALGARAGDVLGLVIRQAGVLALLGITLGLAAAFGLSRFLAGLLYGVSATDPVTFAAAGLLLLALAVLASFLPARRATRIEPVAALRSD